MRLRRTASFCFERRAGQRGAARPLAALHADGRARPAARAGGGYELPFDVDELERGRLARARARRPDARRHRADAVDRRAPRRPAAARSSPTASTPALAADGGLPARGSGWSSAGSSPAWRTTSPPAAARPASGCCAQSLDQLLVRNRAPSHLFRHFGARGWRRRFPNFATQIYSVLALAVVGRHGLDDRALPAARAAADRLLEHAAARRRLAVAVRRRARDRGGALRGLLGAPGRDGADGAVRAVRRPPATRATCDAVVRGLRWIHGAQRARPGHGRPREPARAALDPPPPRARPPRGSPRKTGASLAGLPTPGSTARLTEPNPTDRPYHFGWVLEAWCGREDAASGAAHAEPQRPRSTSSSSPTTAATRCAAASSRSCALPWANVTVVDNACPERLVGGGRRPAGAHRASRRATAASPTAATSGRRRARPSSCCCSTRTRELDRAQPRRARRRAARRSAARRRRPAHDRRRVGRAPVHPAALPAPALDLRPGAVPAPRGAARDLVGRRDPRSRRLRAPRHAGLGVRLLRAAAPLGVRVGRRARRGLLPLRRGDRPLPAPGRGRLARGLRAARAAPHDGDGSASADTHGALSARTAASATRASTTARSSPCSRRLGLALGSADARGGLDPPARARPRAPRRRPRRVARHPHRRRHAYEQPQLRHRHARAQRAREPAAPRASR